MSTQDKVSTESEDEFGEDEFGGLAPLPSMYHALFGAPPPEVSAARPETPSTSPLRHPFLPSIQTSPLVGTREQRATQLKAKRTRRKEAAETEAGKAQQAFMDGILSQLSSKGVSFGDLMEYVFDPALGQGDIRYRQFFIRHGRATQILNWWTSSENSQTARSEVESWAFRYTAKVVKNEAREVTKSKKLQTAGKPVNEKFVMSFSYEKFQELLETTLAPVAMTMFRAFSVSGREKAVGREAKTNMVTNLSAAI